MAAYEISEDYEAIHIPDVTQTFRTLVEKAPVTISLFPLSDRRAKLNKHEWLEYKKTQVSWTVDGDCGTAVLTLVLDDTTGVKAKDVLKFEKPDGSSTSVKAKVVSVDSGTNLTIERLGTDEIILDNSVAYLVARPKAEHSTGDPDDNAAPSRVYNYTQIFRRDFKLSRTTLQSQVYGLATEADQQDKLMSLINFQTLNKLREIAYELNHSFIDGYKEERDEAAGDYGMMGGILYFLEENSESRYDASGADLTPTILNNAIQQAAENGGMSTEMTVMLCHPTQARNISAFNSSGNNPLILRGDPTAGQYVAQYQSDLSGSNGGALSTVVVDINFPQDKVAILNPNDIEIVPMEPLSVVETTDKDADGRQWKVLGELTAEIRNASSDHILVEGLAV